MGVGSSPPWWCESAVGHSQLHHTAGQHLVPPCPPHPPQASLHLHQPITTIFFLPVASRSSQYSLRMYCMFGTQSVEKCLRTEKVCLCQIEQFLAATCKYAEGSKMRRCWHYISNLCVIQRGPMQLSICSSKATDLFSTAGKHTLLHDSILCSQSVVTSMYPMQNMQSLWIAEKPTS